MIGNPFNVVPMHVARNPVTRAVSRKMLVDALRHFQLRVHLMRDGEDASTDVHACIKALTVCVLAMEHAGHTEDPSISVMRGAQSALIQCAARGNRWRALDATAVDQGLQCVADLYPQLPAASMTWGWQELQRIEARVVANISEAVPA